MNALARVRSRLRKAAVAAQAEFLRRVWGMNIGPGARISMKARLDKTNPQGIHIGEDTGVGPGAVILTHDFIRTRHVDTVIGRHCHIGINAIILPGVTIGDSCIVAPGSIVMRDVPAGSLVAGNPARVIESGLDLGPWGIRNWDGKR